jgi:hypothetical protein
VVSSSAGTDNPFVGLFGMMPTDTVPFSNHPLFQEFYEKLDTLFKLFLHNFYVGADGAALVTERIVGSRRGAIPKKYTRARIPDLIRFGRDFAEEWDRRFAGVVGRASAFFPIAESDIFVPKVSDHATQIRNMLLLSASETRPEALVLLECSRIFKNVNHVRLLGPHDRLQDSLVVVAAMNHLLILAASILSDGHKNGDLWNMALPCQSGYEGPIRLTLGSLVQAMIIRGMDPDIYDTETLTPRALNAEIDYRPDVLNAFGREVWPDGPVSALVQMFEDIPSDMHDELDRLLVEVFHTPHSQLAADPWFQSPYTSITLASAAQLFLNLLSIPFSQSLPLAEVGFFPMVRKNVISSLISEPTTFSESLVDLIEPTLDSIEQQTRFNMPDDYPQDNIVFGPVHRRLTGPSFEHMLESYRLALLELSRRKNFQRLKALLEDVGNEHVQALDGYLNERAKDTD